MADDVCKLDEEGERIATLIVHDANLGGTALARGCTDLVVAGHLHVQKGPTQVVGENGKVGYTYTNGTTGGAAYALAIGSKPVGVRSSPWSPSARAGRSGSSR